MRSVIIKKRVGTLAGSFALLLTTAGGACAQTPEEFATFALENPGDAQRGAEVFSAEASLCSTCHTIDGKGGKLGPDLGSIGNKFDRKELIDAIINPASTVAVGYGMTVVKSTVATYAGVLKSVLPEAVELMEIDGRVVRIPTETIESRSELGGSMMPAGLYAAVGGKQAFSDLVSYLESLRSAFNPEEETPGSPSRIPAAVRGATLEPAFGLTFDHPTWLGWIPGRGMDGALVLEHTGRILELERDGEKMSQRTVLDMRGIVRPGGATGLLGLDFHPDFEENRKYYIKYHRVEDGRILTVVEERVLKDDFDDGRGKTIIIVPTVTQDHNGGSVGFGPDGFLYVGLGDSGPQRDPQGHGQDKGTLLGKIIRLDVDHPDEGRAYSIPKDNPFVGMEGARPEIWAYGFREPYRFSWDEKTGDMWVGDVGQDRIEEVSIVRRGENHGWNVYEGHYEYSNDYRRGGGTYVPPVMSYSHRIGVSVTGGYVYHGKRAPQMDGWYIFGDYERRQIWAITQTDRKLGKYFEIARAPSKISAFSKAPDGELYVVGFDNGTIYKLDLEPVEPQAPEMRVVAEDASRGPVNWRFVTEDPGDAWWESGHDDSGWSLGPAAFGAGDRMRGNIRTQWAGPELWMRREFMVSPDLAAAAGRLALLIRQLGEVEVFLNGEKIFQRRDWNREVGEEPLAAGIGLLPGRNVVAVHCRQDRGDRFIDIGLIKQISPR